MIYDHCHHQRHFLHCIFNKYKFYLVSAFSELKFQFLDVLWLAIFNNIQISTLLGGFIVKLNSDLFRWIYVIKSTFINNIFYFIASFNEVFVLLDKSMWFKGITFLNWWLNLSLANKCYHNNSYISFAENYCFLEIQFQKTWLLTY